nr:2-hydroxymuconate semialdehyde hydrolase-like [Nerophis lumbriciformis]
MARRRISNYWVAAILGLIAVVPTALIFRHYRMDIPPAELEQRYADATSQFAEIDGVRMHYRDQGSGPPLLLLHGTASSLHTWDGWAAELADEFRVLRLDLPGFGLTGPAADHDYRTERYVEHLAAFLDHLGVARVHLAGNSLGGLIAWRFAAAHPERVERLVLIDAAGFPPPQRRNIFDVGRTPGVRQMATRVTPRFLFSNALLEIYADPSKVTPELIDRYYLLTLRRGNRAALVARLSEPGLVYPDRLREIDHPTLVMWGRLDPWLPVEHADRFAEFLPNAELLIYDDAGHLPMEELPSRSAADVRRFLLDGSGVDGSAPTSVDPSD